MSGGWPWVFVHHKSSRSSELLRVVPVAVSKVKGSAVPLKWKAMVTCSSFVGRVLMGVRLRLGKMWQEVGQL